MKKIISIFALGAALMWVSCTKEGPIGVNTISDLYTVPADAVTLSAPTATSAWSTDRRYFDLSFGSALSTTLVGYDALLAPGQYVLGADEIGKAILAKTTVNGQPAKEGYITVGCRDAVYMVSALIDGQSYAWQGSLPFTPDPEPTALSVLQSASKSDGLVTLQLATAGISQEYVEVSAGNWQPVWKGEGKYLALDLYSPDGYLHDGKYRASAQGGVVGEGEFGRGWDPGDIYNMGWEFTDWGTCLWTVANGAATATKITGGLVAVSSEEVDDQVVWTISWGEKYPLEVVFTGAIPDLTKPKASPDFAFTYTEKADVCYDPTFAVVEGVNKHCVTVLNAAGAAVLYLELVRNEGETEIEGEYESAEYARVAGQLANGFSIPGFMEGGSYYIAEDGTKVFIEVGVKVTVKKLVTGAYEFISDGAFDIMASGPDYVPGSYKPGDDGAFDGVVLTQFCGLTNYYLQYGESAPIIGVDLATADVQVTPGDWGNTYTGSGNYLKLEFGTADGNIATGTYTACTTGGTVGTNEFGIGYDGWFGASGTTWYTVAETNTYQYVTDGTLTIDKEGDNYVIILKSSVVNAKYVGPLSK